jgi:hypothetical protein
MTSWKCYENKWFYMKYIGKYLSVEILLTRECSYRAVSVVKISYNMFWKTMINLFNISLPKWQKIIIFSKQNRNWQLMMKTTEINMYMYMQCMYTKNSQQYTKHINIKSKFRYNKQNTHSRVKSISTLRYFPYIFHIKPFIFKTFFWSHSLSDFNEIFSIKCRNKYSFFIL